MKKLVKSSLKSGVTVEGRGYETRLRCEAKPGKAAVICPSWVRRLHPEGWVWTAISD